MKTAALFIGLIASQLLLAQDKPGPQENRRWSRTYFRAPMTEGKDARLECDGVSQDAEHLVGEFSLTRERDGVALAIQGHLNKTGEFTPNVSLEVCDRADGSDCKSIESSLTNNVDVTLSAAPHIKHLLVRIQLDALKPHIGNFKFCRVVFQKGEDDIFPMAWLTEKEQ
jgi:hypothetical protein